MREDHVSAQIAADFRIPFWEGFKGGYKIGCALVADRFNRQQQSGARKNRRPQPEPPPELREELFGLGIVKQIQCREAEKAQGVDAQSQQCRVR